MRKLVWRISWFGCCLVLLIGCTTGEPSNKDAEVLFLYKGSNLSDNNEVGTIIRSLPENEQMNNFSLYSDERHIMIRYSKSSLKNARNTAVTHATFIFNLVNGVEWITFRFGDRRFSLYEDDLTKWYDGENFLQITNEKELNKLIHHYLDNQQKVDQLFKL